MKTGLHKFIDTSFSQATEGTSWKRKRNGSRSAHARQ
jgi:hypothetical protein